MRSNCDERGRLFTVVVNKDCDSDSFLLVPIRRVSLRYNLYANSSDVLVLVSSGRRTIWWYLLRRVR